MVEGNLLGLPPTGFATVGPARPAASATWMVTAMHKRGIFPVPQLPTTSDLQFPFYECKVV